MPGLTYSDTDISEAAARVYHRLAAWDEALLALLQEHTRIMAGNEADIAIISAALDELVRLDQRGPTVRAQVVAMRGYLCTLQYRLTRDAHDLLPAFTGPGPGIPRTPKIRNIPREPGSTPADLQYAALVRLNEILDGPVNSREER
jgi:hypothetical protein